MADLANTKTSIFADIRNHFATNFPNLNKYIMIVVLLCLGVVFAMWSIPQVFDGASTSAPILEDYIAWVAYLFGGIFALFVFMHLMRSSYNLLKSISPESSNDPVSWAFMAYIVFLLIAAFVSAYTTFYGLQTLFFDRSEGVFRFYILPVIIATASFFFILWAWSKPMQVMDRVGPWKKVYLLFVYAPIVGVFIFGISTMTSVIGIGSGAAVKYHLTQTIETYEKSLDEIKRFREQELPLAATARLYGERFNSMADEERRTGRLTGVTGGGAVTRYLEGLGDYALRMDSTLVMNNEETEEQFNTINFMLTSLREELDNGYLDRNFKERTLEFREQFNELRGLMIKMAEESPLPAIRAQAIDGQVLNPQTLLSDHDKSLAEKQDNMIVTLQNMLDKFMERMESQLDNLDQREAPVIPKFEQVSLYQSIVSYWHQIPMVWLLALAMDFGAYVALLLTAVIGSANIRTPNRGSNTADITN